MLPVRRASSESNPLAADLIQYHMAGIFASTFAGYDGCCRNTDQKRESGADAGYDRSLNS